MVGGGWEVYITTVVLAFLVHLVLSDGPPHDVGDGGGDQAEMDFYLQSKQTGETGVSVRCSKLSFIKHTACPRRLGPFFVVSYYIKWVKTS